MKTRVVDDQIILSVNTTGGEIKQIPFPTKHPHRWYPFNVNFSYRYSDSKDYLYLIQERDHIGDNVYSATILKRTKELAEVDGVMFHPEIFKRNVYIINKARSLNIPVISEEFTLKQVQDGFKRLSVLHKAVKDQIEARYIANSEDAWHTPDTPSEAWDRAAYEYAFPVELEILTELGEMYSMLCLMRKIAEGR